MTAPRTITIVVHDGNKFDVHEGERYADMLCWDEMLGQVAQLTHPKILEPRYRMLTQAEHDAYEQRMAARAAANNQGAAE